MSNWSRFSCFEQVFWILRFWNNRAEETTEAAESATTEETTKEGASTTDTTSSTQETTTTEATTATETDETTTVETDAPSPPALPIKPEVETKLRNYINRKIRYEIVIFHLFFASLNCFCPKLLILY